MRAVAQGGVVLAAMQPHQAAWIAGAVQARLALAGVDDLGADERACLVEAVEKLTGVALSISPELARSVELGLVRRPA